MKYVFGVIVLLLMAGPIQSVAQDCDMQSRTLRVDYIFSGTDKSSEISLPSHKIYPLTLMYDVPRLWSISSALAFVTVSFWLGEELYRERNIVYRGRVAQKNILLAATHQLQALAEWRQILVGKLCLRIHYNYTNLD